MPLSTNYAQHWPAVVHVEFEVHDIDDTPAAPEKDGITSANNGLPAKIA